MELDSEQSLKDVEFFSRAVTRIIGVQGNTNIYLVPSLVLFCGDTILLYAESGYVAEIKNHLAKYGVRAKQDGNNCVAFVAKAGDRILDVLDKAMSMKNQMRIAQNRRYTNNQNYR